MSLSPSDSEAIVLHDEEEPRKVSWWNVRPR